MRSNLLLLVAGNIKAETAQRLKRIATSSYIDNVVVCANSSVKKGVYIARKIEGTKYKIIKKTGSNPTRIINAARAIYANSAKVGFIDIDVPANTWLLPVLGGGVAIIANDNKVKQAVGGGMAVIGLAQYFRAKANEAPSDDEIIDDSPIFGDTPINEMNQQTIKTVAQLLRAGIQGSNWNSRCSAFKTMYEQPTNYFQAITNYYKNTYQVSLRNDMATLWVHGCASWFTDWGESVLKRLDELQIP